MTPILRLAIRTACMHCGIQWLKPWPQPEPDDGIARNTGCCVECLEKHHPNVSAVVRANREG